ncbi:Endogenous retrovirus group V member 2 Env polyprotein, partial [Eudyptula minor novaehollandiae]
ATYYKYQGGNPFCGFKTSQKNGGAQNLGALGGESKRGIAIWNNGTPKALPPEVFLICGDRAWQGIPANVYGGPCYLGKLTLLAPGQNWWKNITNTTRLGRQKRNTKGLVPDCRDDVTLLSETEKVFLSLFIPGAAAARALNEVGKLACWAENQANVTTEVIESLLEGQNSLRHAILQNRAAIDFLLLAQGHGCEEIEGMCCMNLSDHGESIHKQLQWLKGHARKIQQSQGLFDSWLESLFGTLPSWLTSLLKEGLRILIILIILGVCFCIVF